MKHLKWMLLLALAPLMTGCLSIELKATAEPNIVAVKGLGTAYVAASGIDEYDTRIVALRLLGNPEQPGELVGVKLWPFLDVGVGLVGARLKVLPVEAGLGLLFYYPRPTGPYVDNPPDVRIEERHEETVIERRTD